MAGSPPHPMRALVAFSLFVGISLSGCFGQADDEDGLSEDVERKGWDVTIRLIDGTERSYHVRSDPYEADADGEGLDDELESLHGTDPNKADTDADGLLDGEDVTLEPGSRRSRAWLSEGIAYEDRGDRRVFLGERGNDSHSRGGDPRHADTDADGLPDGLEAGGFEVVVNGETRIVKTSVIYEDADGDLLWDGEERDLGLDPSVRDTDGDGVIDGVDRDPWRDLHARIVFEGLDVETGDGISFRWIAPGITYDSPLGDRDDALDTFSSDLLDLDDSNGNVRKGQFNASMGLSAIVHDGGNGRVLDLFSTTNGSPFLNFRLNVLDGTMRLGQDPPGSPWPENGRFQGPDGSVVFRVVPSGPEGASV